METSYILKYKLPLKTFLNAPIKKRGHNTYEVFLSDLEFNKITTDDIKRLDGQYDWINVWCDRDYDKKLYGFSNKDVLMEVVYDKGNYIITLVSDKSFDTIVKIYRNYSSNSPSENITLKEAIERFLEGCIWDGIGENPIGYIKYQSEELEIWITQDLIEI